MKAGTKKGFCLKDSPKGGSCGFTIKPQARCKPAQKPPLYCSQTLSPGKCVAAQVKKLGEACNASGDNTEPIKICDTGLTCDATTKRCVAAQTATLYEQCGGSTGKQCASTQVCITMSSGATHGYCLLKCNPSSATCSNGASCVKLSSGTDGACLPIGTRGQDQKCSSSGSTGTKLNTSTMCKAKMSCIIFSSGATTGLCLPKVTKCSSTACASGRVCLSLQDGSGICAKDCKRSAALCPSGTKCASLTSGEKICGPN